MKAERSYHMAGGDDDASYAANSKIQGKAIAKSRPLLQSALEEAHARISSPPGTMVVADLGCSSGPNTLAVVSMVLDALAGRCEKKPVHVQFFLNDLPGNDFNLVFRSLEHFNEVVGKDRGEAPLPPYYVAGLPGSFYTRLFPDRSVHIFHSSYGLMIRSRVPEELVSGAIVNEGNVYIWETTPPSVVKAYQEQFRKDFSLFLELRHTELVAGGQMVLTFLGRKNKDVLRGEMSYIWGLLAKALRSLVQQGRVEKEKLESFNFPLYAPSLDEVEAVIEQSGLFDVDHVELFATNWDPKDDDTDSDVVLDSVQSGMDIARGQRAVSGPLLAHHFGEGILDDLFEMYARNLGEHLEKVKTKYAVILLSLKAKRAEN
uniref:Uncharacterized protein n=1 Tax=Avena sativa TaxID=4498 RepID=A0ACD5ZDW3_AVESA